MKSKVVRLMDGTEKKSDDCYAHALFIREEGELAKVVTEEGAIIWWPMCRVVDDATDDERDDFYAEISKSRSQQAAEYRRKI